MEEFYDSLSEEQRTYVFRRELKKHSAKGGKKLLITKGSDYFKDLNRRSHEKRRQNKLRLNDTN